MTAASARAETLLQESLHRPDVIEGPVAAGAPNPGLNLGGTIEQYARSVRHLQEVLRPLDVPQAHARLRRERVEVIEVRDALEAHDGHLEPGGTRSAFGPLELTKVASLGAGGFYSKLTNIGEKGEIVPPDHRQVLVAQANALWHTDSSFRPMP